MHAVASKGRRAATRNAGIYENRSTSTPTITVKRVAASPAPRPLKPVTEPTISDENRSEGRVRPMVDQAAQPKSAMQIKASAQAGLETSAAGTPARIGTQLVTQIHFRVLRTGIPLLISNPEIQPAEKFPASAATKGIQAKAAMDVKLNPRALLKY